MTGDDLGFVHRFVPAPESAQPPPAALLLLHGTGGDEDDLVPLGRALVPGWALVSPRGKVLEGGAPRFFRRLAEGVFDQEDLVARTHELAGFVEAAAVEYGLDRDRIVAVGFSNGANIGASLLLLHPGLLAGAVLLRAMVPFEPDPLPDLTGTPDDRVRAEVTCNGQVIGAQDAGGGEDIALDLGPLGPASCTATLVATAGGAGYDLALTLTRVS